MLERLLERISVSNYKYKFVLKGGMLITAIVGIDMRNTLDMDATIKGFDLGKKTNLWKYIKWIFNIDLDDGVTFEFTNIKRNKIKKMNMEDIEFHWMPNLTN